MNIEKASDAHFNIIARVIAFYLPQFHQIAENDEWWEPGFTEWTNVRRARPLFKGHDQPRVPGELGYYDLLDANVRMRQADLARQSGIEGFCYWHYWFGEGRRILERPFAEVLAAGEPDLPFCLAWANQTWTGVWHGAPGRILMQQKYPGVEDEAEHFRLLIPAFRDPRYIAIDGKPIFVVYAPADLPDPENFVLHWRKLAVESGFPGLYLIGMSNNPYHPALRQFDATMQFGPGDFLDRKNQPSWIARAARIVSSKYLSGILSDDMLRRLRLPARYDYSDVVTNAFSSDKVSDSNIPCVLSGWDNTPRSGRRGVVFENFSVELFRAYVKKALACVRSKSPHQRLVFIKAWNEWAEGNYLEPDAAYGRELLEVVRSEVLGQGNFLQ